MPYYRAFHLYHLRYELRNHVKMSMGVGLFCIRTELIYNKWSGRHTSITPFDKLTCPHNVNSKAEKLFHRAYRLMLNDLLALI